MKKLLIGLLALGLFASVSSAVQLGQGLGDVFSINTCSIDATGNLKTSGKLMAEGGTYLYTRTVSLAATSASAGDFAEFSAISFTVDRSGIYFILGNLMVEAPTVNQSFAFIKVGSSTYTSATYECESECLIRGTGSLISVLPISAIVSLAANDTVHLGASITGSGVGNRIIYGSNVSSNKTKNTRSTYITAIKLD